MKLPLATLKDDKDNARGISVDALAGLEVSVETFGDLSGITWNERTGELVTGHQRMKVLRKAGATEWTREGDRGVIVHPGTGQRFPIRIVDWDETMQRMANLVANNPSIQGEFTVEAVAQLRQLEEQAAFESLNLHDLADDLEKELQKELKAAEGEAGAEDESEKLRSSFAIIIECGSEEQQRELLDRLMGEGLACRALI